MHGDASPTKSVAPQTNARSPLPFAALVFGNVALAFGPWFVRLSDTGPVASGFWRLALAAPVLLIAGFGTGWRPRGWTWQMWGLLALGAVCFAADLGSWHLGILKTTLANATLFGNSTILIFPLYGFLVARAWPSRMQGIALLLAAIGAGLLMGRSYQLDPRHLGGDLLCVLAGILYTGYFIFMGRVRETTPPLPALALSTVMSILPALAFALFLGERIVPTNWTPLIGLALVSQIFGQFMMVYALGKISPLVVGLTLLVQPIVAASVGWIVYGERLGLPDLVGAVLVAIALVLVREKPPQQPAPVAEIPLADQMEPVGEAHDDRT
jgi:drug/metabolite transporter (DMT)-like permease